MTGADVQVIRSAYRSSLTRLFFLDYDGTLVPFVGNPQRSQPSPEAKAVLSRIATDPLNQVIVISGRDQKSLDMLLGDCPVTLVAEHGAFYRNARGTWRQVFPRSRPKWKQRAMQAFEALKFHYQKSIVEEKEYSVGWHYREVEEEIPAGERKRIIGELENILWGEFEVVDSESVIELRTPGIDKGSFARRWLSVRSHDFILAIGDSRTDEDLFAKVPSNQFSVKVGEAETAARYCMESQRDVLPFLQQVTTR